jgi:hypothetical protein
MDPYAVQMTQSITTVSQLMEKYRDNPYMFAKINNYVCFQLPNIMENIRKNHEERQHRIAELTVEQDGFIDRFLSTHRYFYVPITEKFVSYDGLQYEVKSEDSILHHILTTITSDEKQLMGWKQRTKVYIMKRIKENALYKSVPESETIQFVLENIHPVLFETKEEAKYFLTILGDVLLRKRNDIVHFIPPKAKTFLRELSNISLYLFGINATTTFKHKYYDHDYDKCRMVKINDTIESEHIWGNILQTISVNLLCVACHYSIRYGSSDEYVLRFNNQDTLEKTVFFLKNNSQDQLVAKFISEYLQVSLNGTSIFTTPNSDEPRYPSPKGDKFPRTPSASASATQPKYFTANTPPAPISNLVVALNDTSTQSVRTISWRNMQYLWSHYLSSLQLPTIMFQQDLKMKLTCKLAENYKEDIDMFIGVSSKYMPYIRSFIHFWESTIDYDETGEYEMDELCMLYKKWLNLRNSAIFRRDEVSYENAERDEASYETRLCTDFSTHALVRSKCTQGLTESNGRSKSAIFGRDEVSYKNERYYANSLNERQMLDLILYYFPNIEIEKDKYVFQIRCRLWDKQLDVQTALTQMQDFIRESNTVGLRSIPDAKRKELYSTSIYDAYVWYCKYYSELREKHPLVSKSYFEKYIRENMEEYVVDDNYLSNEWVGMI